MMQPTPIPLVTDVTRPPRVVQRPGVVSVTAWTLVGWVVASFLVMAPMLALLAVDADVSGGSWFLEVDDSPPYAVGAWLLAAWALTLALRLTLPRTAGNGRVAWTWLAVWAPLAALVMLLPGMWWLLGLVLVAIPLRWIGWLPDGSARPDPVGLRGRAAWALGTGVVLVAMALIAV